MKSNKVKISKALVFLVILGFAKAGFADEFPAQARLFIGSTNVNPTNLNQEMTAQGLKEFTTAGKLGVEITYPLKSWVNVGMRYNMRNFFQDETNSTDVTNFEGSIKQDEVILLARLPVYKSEYVKVDVFAGVGGSNTTFKLRTLTQDGELSRKEANDWFAAVTSAAGVSAAVGYQNYFFVIEAGIESNKVDSFKRTGTINNNIQNIDLSGSYVTVGVLFDGIKATSK